MSEVKLPVNIQINLSEDECRTTLMKLLCGLSSGCLHTLVDCIPEMALPFSRTRCKQACRYNDRWSRKKLVRTPEGYNEWDNTLSNNFETVLNTILRHVPLTQLVGKLMNGENYIGYHLTVDNVTHLDMPKEN